MYKILDFMKHNKFPPWNCTWEEINLSFVGRLVVGMNKTSVEPVRINLTHTYHDLPYKNTDVNRFTSTCQKCKCIYGYGIILLKERHVNII